MAPYNLARCSQVHPTSYYNEDIETQQVSLLVQLMIWLKLGLEPKTASKASFLDATSKGVPRLPKLVTKPLGQCWTTKLLTPILLRVRGHPGHLV